MKQVILMSSLLMLVVALPLRIDFLNAVEVVELKDADGTAIIAEEQKVILQKLQPWLITLYYAKQKKLNALTILKLSMAISHFRSQIAMTSAWELCLNRYLSCINEKNFGKAEVAYNEFMDLISEQPLDTVTMETIAKEKMKILARY